MVFILRLKTQLPVKCKNFMLCYNMSLGAPATEIIIFFDCQNNFCSHFYQLGFKFQPTQIILNPSYRLLIRYLGQVNQANQLHEIIRSCKQLFPLI